MPAGQKQHNQGAPQPQRQTATAASHIRIKMATGEMEMEMARKARLADEAEAEEQRYWCCRCFNERLQVYVSHFLSSWGDRMWMFAGGLFLLEVTPGSLRLAAIYGASLALTVILMGAPVGRWVDRASRLRVAQLSLSVQNLMVCVCAALLVLITSRPELFTAWEGWALVLAEVGVILTACVAQIGTLGSKLAIEKDWILVICGQDKTRLAGMNSVLRTVDLSTEVFAPVIVGAVMTSAGMAAGGVVIAGWNVGSLLVEYGLLHHLFHSNPNLQKAKGKINKSTESKDDKKEDSEEHAKKEVEEEEEQEGKTGRETETKISETEKYIERQSLEELPDIEAERQRRRENVGVGSAVGRLAAAWGAWRVYMRHPVRNAGLGLALLFMTVLAFDNYSRAFVYDSGVSETVLGVLTAVASLFGIFGSLAFPVLRKKFGVLKTGLIGFACETLCLTLCVASVFAPGSPFDPSELLGHNKQRQTTPTSTTIFSNTTPTTVTTPTTLVTPTAPEPEYDLNASLIASLPHSAMTPASSEYTVDSGSSLFGGVMRELVVDFNVTLEELRKVEEEEKEEEEKMKKNMKTKKVPVEYGIQDGREEEVVEAKVGVDAEKEEDFTFVILLLTGIISSRFGLWVADLTVTQILQERVEEGQRGAINGVQSSLNQSLDLLRSILLIILPRRETFGFLIILSFIFVSMAFAIFATYVWRNQTPTGQQSSSSAAAAAAPSVSGAEHEDQQQLKSVPV